MRGGRWSERESESTEKNEDSVERPVESRQSKRRKLYTGKVVGEKCKRGKRIVIKGVSGKG